VAGQDGSVRSRPAGHDELNCAALAPVNDTDARARLVGGAIDSPHSQGLLYWKVSRLLFLMK